MRHRAPSRRDPIKTALSLVPAYALAWYWWGFLGCQHHGMWFLPMALFFIVLFTSLCVSFWFGFTRVERA